MLSLQMWLASMLDSITWFRIIIRMMLLLTPAVLRFLVQFIVRLLRWFRRFLHLSSSNRFVRTLFLPSANFTSFFTSSLFPCCQTFSANMCYFDSQVTSFLIHRIPNLAKLFPSFDHFWPRVHTVHQDNFIPKFMQPNTPKTRWQHSCLHLTFSYANLQLQNLSIAC